MSGDTSASLNTREQVWNAHLHLSDEEHGSVGSKSSGHGPGGRTDVTATAGEADVDLRDFSKNIRYAFLGNIAGPVGWIVVLPVLSRTLGVDARGAVAAAVGALLLATSLGALGLPETIVFVYGRRAHQLKSTVRICLVLTLISGGAATVVVWNVAPYLSDGRGDVTRLIRIAIIALIPTLLIGVLRGIAMGAQRWALVQADLSIGSIASVVTVLILAFVGHLTTLWATVAMSAGPIVGGFVYLRRASRTSVASAVAQARASSRAVASFAGRVWIGGVMGITLARLDQVLIIPLSDERQLGLYVLAVNVAEIPLLLIGAASQVAYSAESNRADYQQLTQASRVALAAGTAMALIIGVTSPILVPVIFGRQFGPSVAVILVLLIATALSAPGSLAGSGLGGGGRPGLRSGVLLLAASINVVGLIVLVPTIGALGAALATLAGNIVATLGVLFLYTRMIEGRVSEFVMLNRQDVLTIAAAVRRISVHRSLTARRRPGRHRPDKMRPDSVLTLPYDAGHDQETLGS